MSEKENETETQQPSADNSVEAENTPEQAERPKEYGGPRGKEPTRYGDWERKGRCIDF